GDDRGLEGGRRGEGQGDQRQGGERLSGQSGRRGCLAGRLRTPGGRHAPPHRGHRTPAGRGDAAQRLSVRVGAAAGGGRGPAAPAVRTERAGRAGLTPGGRGPRTFRPTGPVRPRRAGPVPWGCTGKKNPEEER